MKKINKSLLIGCTITVILTVIAFICGALAAASFNILAWSDDIRVIISIIYGIGNTIGWIAAISFDD